MFDDCIILAGGSGSRLWPASNSRLPKQFLPGQGGKSFFRLALERGLAASAPSGRVLVIAGKGHVPKILEECAACSAGEKARIILIAEPLARNTAPAIACGTVFAGMTVNPAERARKIIVLTSDHIIEPLEDFLAAAEAASARAGEYLVVFGIKPTRPETGYGYIEAAERLPGSGAGVPVFRAATFQEKPDRETAVSFLAAGNFYWNSGMFGFSAELMLEEFHRSAPDILAPFEALPHPRSGTWSGAGGIRALENWPGLDAAYRAARALSIDYAIMEKCRRAAMAAGNFRWTDVGSWDEYSRLLGKGSGTVYSAPSSGGDSCFVDSEIPVALAGVEDLVVVIRTGKNGGPQAALIAKKGETQKVREIVEALKKDGKTELL